MSFRKVRYADIPTSDRDVFERYGESVIQTMIAASNAPRAAELREMYVKQDMIENAAKWLTERADVAANHERRIEFLEWAILVFLIFSVAIEAVGLWTSAGR